MEKFDAFCEDETYIKTKNSLFNYLNRKKEIEKISKIAGIDSKSVIVDVGSGVSPVSPFPNATLYIDVSQKSIEYLTLHGMRGVCGIIEHIPLPDNHADAVYCSEVLEHVDDYRRAISELVRVTRKKGRVIITVPVYMKYWGFDDEFVGHFRRFEPSIIEEELVSEGLKIVSQKPIGSRMERLLTKLAVSMYKRERTAQLSLCKARMYIFFNRLLYACVKVSVVLSSKKTTSIMLYCCEKR